MPIRRPPRNPQDVLSQLQRRPPSPGLAGGTVLGSGQPPIQRTEPPTPTAQPPTRTPTETPRERETVRQASAPSAPAVAAQRAPAVSRAPESAGPSGGPPPPSAGVPPATFANRQPLATPSSPNVPGLGGSLAGRMANPFLGEPSSPGLFGRAGGLLEGGFGFGQDPNSFDPTKLFEMLFGQRRA